MKKTIVCIGSASRDIFFPLDEARILNTPEDLTAKKHIVLELGAKYRTESRYEVLGGCSLNVSLALARLGMRSFSYSVVGNDLYGEEIIRELVREGVDTRYVVRSKGVSTDVSCILVETKSADRTIVYNRDANEHLSVREEDLQKCEAIFVSGMYGKWKKNLSVIARVAKKKRVFYNPGQGNIREDARQVIKVLAVSEGVFLNKDEAIEIVLRGCEGRDERRLNEERYLAQRIVERGAKYVVLTDGARGAWAFDGRDFYHAKSVPIEHIVESTGAGDAFTGAFLAGYLRGESMAECLRWGIANGGSVVQQYGARDGLLSLREIISVTRNVRVIVVK